jgi:hypothetical protein
MHKVSIIANRLGIPQIQMGRKPLAKGSALDIPAPEHEESAKDDPRVSRGAMVEGPA